MIYTKTRFLTEHMQMHHWSQNAADRAGLGSGVRRDGAVWLVHPGGDREPGQ